MGLGGGPGFGEGLGMVVGRVKEVCLSMFQLPWRVDKLR